MSACLLSGFLEYANCVLNLSHIPFNFDDSILTWSVMLTWPISAVNITVILAQCLRQYCKSSRLCSIYHPNKMQEFHSDILKDLIIWPSVRGILRNIHRRSPWHTFHIECYEFWAVPHVMASMRSWTSRPYIKQPSLFIWMYLFPSFMDANPSHFVTSQNQA